MTKPLLIMTKGLPGSGKSTWAKAQVVGSQGKVKRVNKDDLRAMIDSGEWSKENEADVLAIRDWLVDRWLAKGKTVIVDDTNLAPKHERRLLEIAEAHKAAFRVEDFTHVSLEACIERDLRRPNSVGSKVITKMWRQFLFTPTPTPAPPPYVEGLPNALICDIDGTVAKMNGRSPYDYSRVSEDLPNSPVILAVLDWLISNQAQAQTIAGLAQCRIVFCSGRPDSCRAETEEWLREHVFGCSDISDDVWTLLMRPAHIVDPKSGKQVKNNRKDVDVKRDLYNEHIRGKYNVDYVLDDRNQVVDMWRSLGLTCLQVAPGDF